MNWVNEINNGLNTPGIAALLTGLFVFAGSAFYHVIKVVKGQTKDWQTFLAALVPMITGTTYLTILLGSGAMQLSDGRIFHIARWIDACFVSPLIILSIVLLLGPLIRKLTRPVTLLLIANFLTMFGGLLAGLQTEPVIGWIWYGYGLLAYLGCVLLLLFTIPKAAEKLSVDPGRLKAYRRFAAIYVLITLAFPVIWLFTPAALGQLTLNGEVIAFLPFDLATKVGLMIFVARKGKRL
ncbi:bacteriorhodopsin [Rhodohalobacter sp. 8-1]|uniref:bacteriorhodopsin n=1 Tax=Rhodohalobacter sp. 8-1 TaxID=3131972 RepID=UPI0030EEFC00